MPVTNILVGEKTATTGAGIKVVTPSQLTKFFPTTSQSDEFTLHSCLMEPVACAIVDHPETAGIGVPSTCRLGLENYFNIVRALYESRNAVPEYFRNARHHHPHRD